MPKVRRKKGDRTEEEMAALSMGAIERETVENQLPKRTMLMQHPRPAKKMEPRQMAAATLGNTQLMAQKASKYDKRCTPDDDEKIDSKDPVGNNRTGWHPPTTDEAQTPPLKFEPAGVPGPKTAAKTGHDENEYASNWLTDELFEFEAKEGNTYARQHLSKKQAIIDGLNVQIDEDNAGLGEGQQQQKRKRLDAVVSTVAVTWSPRRHFFHVPFAATQFYVNLVVQLIVLQVLLGFYPISIL